MEGIDTEENSIPWDGGGSTTSKKRRGRRATQDSEYAPLPEQAVIGKDEQPVAELQAAYRILQFILKTKHISSFNEEPTADKYGMSSYFSVIKNPMWLNEVRRKIESGEYEGLHDFVKDVHLILYNCYKFWGPTHRLSLRGYIIEHKLETKLQELPWSLKEKLKCPVSSEECVICSIPEDKKMQADDSLDGIQCDPVDNPDIVYYNSKGYTSKIVVKVMNEESEDVEPDAEEETEEAKELRLKMEKWEEEVLGNLEGASSIPHIPELVDIGVFLKTTHEVLNVEEMTQYEVERMLLIPLESSTLQTLMTSIFSPELKRVSLDETPLMPYVVWNNHLRSRINTWCNIYFNTCDSIETFEQTGIDPYFWSVVHLVNPMDGNRNFHDLTFYVRVWILKSLLDNLAHRQKSISDVFLEEKMNPDGVRHLYLGKGVLNHHYKAVPCFLPEIRVYREISALTSVWKANWPDAEEGIIQLQRNRMSYDDDTLQFVPNRKTFLLVADDAASFDDLVEEASAKQLDEVIEGLTSFKSLLDQSPPHIRCEGLKSIYKQYHDFKTRTCEYFANLENLWLQYQKPKPIVEGTRGDVSEQNNTLLGKRRSLPNRLYNEWSDGESEVSVDQEEASESDVSDWETSYKNHPRKKKLKKSRKLPEPAVEAALEMGPQKSAEIPKENGNDKDSASAAQIRNPHEIKKEVERDSGLLSNFKMEPQEETPVQNGFPEQGDSPMVKVENTTTEAQPPHQPPKTDDVVVIVDSDEEDVKPVISKIKLRDMSTLLQPTPPPLTTPTPPPLTTPPPPTNTSPAMNPMLNSMLNNNLQVVIPMNAINPATNTPMSMSVNLPRGVNVNNLNPGMSVQVPPNMYQRAPGMPAMRQRGPSLGPGNRQQMMVRGGMMRGMVRGGMVRGGMQRPQAPLRGQMRGSVPRQMTVPKPITPKKPVPRPMMMSPQEWAKTPSPTNSPKTPPAVGRGVSPRGRSPATPPQASWPARGNAGANRASIQPKTLFTEAPRAEGKLTMGLNETGSGYCYQIVLDDGGIRFLNDAEVTAIKRKHGGALPRRIAIPPDGSFL